MQTIQSGAMVLAALLALSAPGTTLAQSQLDRQCCTFGLFAGVTDIEGGDSEMTVGGEVEMELAGPWATGVLLEHTSDAYRFSDATLVMGAVHYRPPNSSRLKFTGGAGMEFNDFDDAVRLRAGVGYDAIRGAVTLTPRLAVDFGNGREHLVLGASFHF